MNLTPAGGTPQANEALSARDQCQAKDWDHQLIHGCWLHNKTFSFRSEVLKGIEMHYWKLMVNQIEWVKKWKYCHYRLMLFQTHVLLLLLLFFQWTTKWEFSRIFTQFFSKHENKVWWWKSVPNALFLSYFHVHLIFDSTATVDGFQLQFWFVPHK